MKAFPLIVLLQYILAVPLWSQSPTPKPESEYVVVVGEVRRQGVVPYTPGMKLLEAIDAAGDADFADRIAVDLIRCGKKETIKLRHLRGSPSEPVLQPWDIIYLTPGFW